VVSQESYPKKPQFEDSHCWDGQQQEKVYHKDYSWT